MNRINLDRGVASGTTIFVILSWATVSSRASPVAVIF